MLEYVRNFVDVLALVALGQFLISIFVPKHSKSKPRPIDEVVRIMEERDRMKTKN